MNIIGRYYSYNINVGFDITTSIQWNKSNFEDLHPHVTTWPNKILSSTPLRKFYNLRCFFQTNFIQHFWHRVYFPRKNYVIFNNWKYDIRNLTDFAENAQTCANQANFIIFFCCFLNQWRPKIINRTAPCFWKLSLGSSLLCVFPLAVTTQSWNDEYSVYPFRAYTLLLADGDFHSMWNYILVWLSLKNHMRWLKLHKVVR